MLATVRRIREGVAGIVTFGYDADASCQQGDGGPCLGGLQERRILSINLLDRRTERGLSVDPTFAPML